MKYFRNKMILMFAFIFCVGAGIVFAIPTTTHAALIISEIMYDAQGTDSGREWVEIHNNGTDTIFDITGYRFRENDVNHTISISEDSNTVSVSIDPGEYVILADKPLVFMSDYQSYSGKLFDSAFSFNNSGEGISLTIDDETVDSAYYTSDLGASGDGHSLQMIEDVFIAAIPTPGSVNINNQYEQDDSQNNGTTNGSGNNENENSSDSSSGNGNTTNTTTSGGTTINKKTSTHSDQVTLTTYEPKTLKIGAGRTRYTTVNTPIEFDLFSNTSFNKKEVQWSFGDGFSKKGIHVEHMYELAGEYNVVVRVGDGDKTSVSRTKVIVDEPAIDIQVTDSVIEINNISDAEVNIGEYVIATQDTSFTFSSDTIIDSQSILRIPLRRISSNTPKAVALQYPNRQVAVSWTNTELAYFVDRL